MRAAGGTLIGARNVKGGLGLIALSLAGGLVMSLYAFQPIVPPPAALDRYDDLPRRLARLAHVAAVMLPLLNVLFGLFLDRLRLAERLKGAASWMLLAGAAGLPLALGVEAAWEAARSWHLAGPPAVAFTLGTLLVAAGAWRTPAAELIGATGEPSYFSRGAASKSALTSFSSSARP